MAKNVEQTGIERMIALGLNGHIAEPSVQEEEIPFKDKVEYTTVEQAVMNYGNDPYGDTAYQFLQEAYGIADPDAFLIDAGLEQFIVEKRQKGAFTGAVKSQVPPATPYNLSDPVVVGAVVQRYDVPGCVLCISYSDDVMTLAPEKMEAIGNQRYFTGNDKNGRPQFASVSIVPAAVRSADGSISNVQSLEEIDGHSFRDIFIELRNPLDPRGAQSAFQTKEQGTIEFIEGALGMPWEEILANPYSMQENPGLVSLSQFHRLMFDKTVQRMRRSGYLPDEGRMPIVHAEMADFSRALLKHSRLPGETRGLLGSFAVGQPGVSIDENTGLVLKNGKVDPSMYYAPFTSLVDVDTASLNEDSWSFTGKIHRMQQLLRRHGVPIPTVRIPHGAIPDFDNTRIHPTGEFYDIRQARSDAYQSLQLTGLSKEEQKKRSKEIEATVLLRMQEFFMALKAGGSQEYKRSTELVSTVPVLQWWASVLANLPDEL